MLCVTMINIKIKEFELSFPIVTYSKSTIETVEKRYKICSKLTIKTPERCQRLRFVVFIVGLGHISHHFSSVYC